MSSDLHQIMAKYEENDVRCLELNVPPKYALMKQVVLNVNITQSKMSSSSGNINKRFRVANFSKWIVKD